MAKSKEWQKEDIEKALRYVDRLPGVTGDRILRFMGFDLPYFVQRNRQTVRQTLPSFRFLVELKSQCQVKDLTSENVSVLKARFYSADYQFPELFKPARSKSGLQIAKESPQPFSPPSEIVNHRSHMQEQQAARRREQTFKEKFTVTVKQSEQVSKSSQSSKEQIMADKFTTTQNKAALSKALQELIDRGEAFSLKALTDRAGLSETIIYCPAYSSEKKAAQDAIAIAKKKAIETPIEPKPVVADISPEQPTQPIESKPAVADISLIMPTVATPKTENLLAYFQGQRDACIARVKEMEADLSAELVNLNAWNRMIELHDTGDDLIWIAKAQNSANGSVSNTVKI